MTTAPPPRCVRIRRVGSFHALATTAFGEGINALCWPRLLPGDFRETVDRLGAVDRGDLLTLDEARLRAIPVSPAGRIAVDVLLGDLQLLRDRDLAPVLNCIHGYPRDEDPGPVATDVFSFHADSAPIAADTWLCTYHGAPSEGLPNEDALRRIEIPETRAALLACYGGAMKTASPNSCTSTATISTTRRRLGRSRIPLVCSTSGASPSITPVLPCRPASIARPPPFPANLASF